MIKPFPDEFFMSMALKEAMMALQEEEIPIGSVIVAKNQIVGRGYNQVERLHDVTAHAEIIALTAASNFFNNKYLSGCTIYVTIEPCMMCAAAIGWAQIERVVYGASDPKKGFTLFTPSPLHPKAIVETNVMNDECAELLGQFFRKKRK